MVIGLTEVLENPGYACGVLQGELFGVAIDHIRESRYGGVVVDMTFAPPPELVAERYEVERGRIIVRSDGGICAFPLGPKRTWRHRNPSPLGHAFGNIAGELCLWYGNDPRALRWEWVDGLEQYVTRVYRHLYYEEYFRRSGEWPVEDAPHGNPIDGAYAIHTASMRKEVQRWPH